MMRATSGVGGDRRCSARGTAQPPQGIFEPIELVGDGGGEVEHGLPGRRHPHAAAGALEHAQAELLLDQLDLLGERRLGNAELQRRLAETAGASDRNEIGDLAGVQHAARLSPGP
jgi:hypothetical protein